MISFIFKTASCFLNRCFGCFASVSVDSEVGRQAVTLKCFQQIPCRWSCVGSTLEQTGAIFGCYSPQKLMSFADCGITEISNWINYFSFFLSGSHWLRHVGPKRTYLAESSSIQSHLRSDVSILSGPLKSPG